MLFVGHSHMVCVLNAALKAGISYRAVCIKSTAEERRHDLGEVDWSLVSEDRGKPDFSDESKALFAGPGPIFSFIGGNKHVEIMLRHVNDLAEPRIDFVLPERPDAPLEPNAVVVPVDAIRMVLRQGFRSRFRLLERVMRATTSAKVYQFGPPPMVPDRHYLRMTVKWGAPASECPSATFRWKLWRLTNDVFREEAARLGATFVDSPPESVDEHGILREEMVRNLTHGNEAYGTLVLNQIRQLS